MIKCDQVVIFNLDTIKFPKLDPLILDIFQEQHQELLPVFSTFYLLLF